MATRAVVVNESNQVVFPPSFMMVQTFTAATKAATAPVSITQVGYETDTGTLYKATGIDAGDWEANAGGLRLVMSGDSYVAVMDGDTEVGRIALIIP
jgi:uncharacterized cupin superfamily protein